MTNPPNIPFLMFCASAAGAAIGVAIDRAYNYGSVISANRACQLHKAERAKLALRNIQHIETIEDLRGQLRELSEQLTAANEHADAMRKEVNGSVFGTGTAFAILDAQGKFKK